MNPRLWLQSLPGHSDDVWAPAKEVLENSGQELTGESLEQILRCLEFIFRDWPSIPRNLTWTESAVLGSVCLAVLARSKASVDEVGQVLDATKPHAVDYGDRALYGPLAGLF